MLEFFIFQRLIHKIKNKIFFLFHGPTWCSQNVILAKGFILLKNVLYFLIFYISRTNPEHSKISKIQSQKFFFHGLNWWT